MLVECVDHLKSNVEADVSPQPARDIDGDHLIVLRWEESCSCERFGRFQFEIARCIAKSRCMQTRSILEQKNPDPPA